MLLPCRYGPLFWPCSFFICWVPDTLFSLARAKVLWHTEEQARSAASLGGKNRMVPAGRTEASLLAEAYLNRYEPDVFLRFYDALAEEFHLKANPVRVIPISPVPLFLDGRWEDAFAGLVRLLWNILSAEPYRRLSALRVPEPLLSVPFSGCGLGTIPFEASSSVGCLDLHLEGVKPRLIEFMVLPPGMVGIYPGLLERYGEHLEGLLPGCRIRAFREGEDRRSCEALMAAHILKGGGRECGRFAIVDWEPQRQITYGEFLYTADTVRTRFGIEAVIADPREVVWTNGEARVRGMPVDRILNRLTLVDWLEQLEVLSDYTRILREAPALFAHHPHLWYLGDKASLAVLSDSAALEGMGIAEEDRKALGSFLPLTVRLADFADSRTGEVDVESLIRCLGPPAAIVLKPLSSHASKGVVYGPVDTPTADAFRRVLTEIDPARYVAMKLVAPPEIAVPRGGGASETWRWDLRLFVLNGRFLFAGGRVYLGAFTNQTPCRAFAPLFFV